METTMSNVESEISVGEPMMVLVCDDHSSPSCATAGILWIPGSGCPDNEPPVCDDSTEPRFASSYSHSDSHTGGVHAAPHHGSSPGMDEELSTVQMCGMFRAVAAMMQCADHDECASAQLDMGMGMDMDDEQMEMMTARCPEPAGGGVGPATATAQANSGEDGEFVSSDSVSTPAAGALVLLAAQSLLCAAGAAQS